MAVQSCVPLLVLVCISCISGQTVGNIPAAVSGSTEAAAPAVTSPPSGPVTDQAGDTQPGQPSTEAGAPAPTQAPVNPVTDVADSSPAPNNDQSETTAPEQQQTTAEEGDNGAVTEAEATTPIQGAAAEVTESGQASTEAPEDEATEAQTQAQPGDTDPPAEVETTAQPADPACAMSDDERRECHGTGAGTTEESCVEKGCCWQRSVTGAPWCFYKASHVSIPRGECLVQTSDKVECGGEGISEAQCQQVGCCWWTSSVPNGVPWCYYKAGHSPSTAADIATSPVTSRAARLTTPEAAETTVGTPPSTYPPGKVLRVVGVHAPPYLDASNADNETTGNSQYQGFIMDYMERIVHHMEGYGRFEMRLAPDGQYGREQNGKWSGMIGEIIENRTDVAAAPLTVTVERERVVDFTDYFQRFEASMIFLKRHPSMKPKLETLLDLVNQTDIDPGRGVDYGVTRGGAIATFLEESQEYNPLYKQMWEYVNEKPARSLLDTNNDGVQKARGDHSYVHILEGPLAQYVAGKEPCDLDTLEAGFYGRRYAFAVANQSPLRDTINAAMVEVEFEGELERLKQKWFSNECSGAPGPLGSSLGWLLLAALAVIRMTS